MDGSSERVMDMQPIEPSRQLSATLTAEQWNVVMFVMRKHPLPYEVSAPIIDSLVQELQRQNVPHQQMTAAPNGA
jgi:sulfur relay (sulfurtransferase) DsrC/TusE family protein